MLTASVEQFTDCIEEFPELFQQHWEELALNKDKVPLSPDWKRYKLLEDNGILLHIALREQGKLVGYFVGFIMPHLHYTTCNTYTMDMMFISPGARGHNGGIIMMRALERECKNRGVHRMVLNTKLHKDISQLFKYFGFEPIETIYSKWIGD